MLESLTLASRYSTLCSTHGQFGTWNHCSICSPEAKRAPAQHVGRKALSKNSPFLLAFSDEWTETRYGEWLPERKQVFLFGGLATKQRCSDSSRQEADISLCPEGHMAIL